MDLGPIALVAAASVAAGLVQGTTGFGAGIVVMLALPQLFGVLGASAVSVSSTIAFCALMAWRYRDAIEWRQIPAPAALFLATSSACVMLARGLDPSWLRVALGAFLVAFSAHALVAGTGRGEDAGRLGPAALLACVVGSGICDGLFGIGGPLMVVYFLSRVGDKRAYLGTLQAFFLMGSVYGAVFRAGVGVLTAELLGAVAVCSAGLLVGLTAANRIVDRIDMATLRRLVYVVICACGCLNVWMGVVG